MPVYTYTTIDDPLDIGRTEPIGIAINNMGQIVGNYVDIKNGVEAGNGFLYSNGTYTTIDDPLAFNSTNAFGINDVGQIVGAYDGAGNNNSHGFLYSNGTYTTLDVQTTLGAPSTHFTIPGDINNADQIVGSYSDASGFHGFLYDTSRGVLPP